MAVEEESKVWAFLAYFISIIGIVLVLSLRKRDSFAKYHAQQSTVLIIFGLLIYVVGFVPIIGKFVLWPLGSLLIFIFWIQGMIHALTGKKTPLWIIGQWGDKLKF